MFTTLQATIKSPITFSGKGLHFGEQTEVTLSPAKQDSGITIEHLHGTSKFKYPAVIGSSRGTNVKISNSFQIATIEHLISALIGMGIDNCKIKITGDEIPAAGGSARIFAEKIAKIGITTFSKQKSFLELKNTFCYKQENKAIVAIPDNHFRTTVVFDFPNLPTQVFSFNLFEDNYLLDIAPARTFGFAQELEELRAKGYIKGADLSNAILIEGTKGSAKDMIPFELARHKTLDLIGDLFALGSLPKAHIIAIRCGHEINNLFVKSLLTKYDN